MVVICKICNKEYASYASRSNHIKRSHSLVNDNIHIKLTNNPPEIATIPPEIATIPPEIATIPPEIAKNDINCEHCKKIFTRIDSLKKHYDRCKIKNNEDFKLKQENEILKNKVETFEKEIELLKSQMIEIMNKQNKVH